MNFFEQQDRARKKTGRLIVLFIVAVVMILAAVNAAAFGIMRLAAPHVAYVTDAGPVAPEDREFPGRLSDVEPIWRKPFGYAGVTGCTLLIILGGTLYKTAMLSRGGAALAESLGGRPLALDAASPKDRLLQNVVEEMSIASGVPVPQVYVMENEAQINAFAAGIGTEDAVIGVTRGCLDKLNRDELQGVVAHEFSHILNGDMRLNLRLIGILHGILVIALLGFGVLRSFGRVRVSRGSRDNGGGAAVIILIALSGVALLVIGYVGVFFGRLIQAAVSRQREYLADASAVQFTRNPAGLVGALRKIMIEGSKVNHHNAIEAAHMFFGSAGGWSMTRLLATHPPLEDRIRAIDPIAARLEATRGSSDTGGSATPTGAMGFAGGSVTLAPESLAQHVGSPNPQSLHFAQALVSQIPAPLLAAARDPYTARSVVFAILLSEDPGPRADQLDLLRQNLEPLCYNTLRELDGPITSMGSAARLPLLDLALPALRRMSQEQIAHLKAIVRALIQADRKISLFEFALARVLDQNLRQPDLPVKSQVQYVALGAVRDEAATVLSALASASDRDTQRAFAAGAGRLDPENPPSMRDFEDLAALDAALKKLARASGAVKQRVIDAAAHVVVADGQVDVAEAELLRAVAATIDVPIPPLWR